MNVLHGVAKYGPVDSQQNAASDPPGCVVQASHAIKMIFSIIHLSMLWMAKQKNGSQISILGVAFDKEPNHIILLFGFQNLITAGSGPGWKIG